MIIGRGALPPVLLVLFFRNYCAVKNGLIPRLGRGAAQPEGASPPVGYPRRAL